MRIVITFFSIIILLSVLLKYEWGIGFYLLYFFLVPLYSLVFGGISIGYNVFYLLLLLLLLLWSSQRGGIRNKNISLLIPFLFFYFAQGLLIPFHSSEMSMWDQLKYLRVDLMGSLFPFAIIGVLLASNHSRKLYVNILFIAILISSLYTVFLLTRIGDNPYIDSIGPLLYSYDDSGQEKVLEEGIRQFGYISSVYSHVTEYGVFLIFSSVFLLNYFNHNKTVLPKVLFGLILVCVFVCGSRSTLMAEGAVVLFYLLQQKRFKLFLIVILFLLLGFVLIQTFLPDYMLFISSIRDGGVKGSSLEMRWDQFNGCIASIRQNPLVGNGYNWTGWYRNTIGRHPVMLSFESSLMQILCNNGIMGIVIWLFFFFLLLKSIKKNFPGNKILFQTVILMIVGYFSYTFLTGDYGAFRVMAVFYCLILAREMQCPEFDSSGVKRNN